MINPDLAVTEQYPDNILQRLEAAETEILSIRREIGGEMLAQVEDTSISNLLLFPDVGVEVTDPTDPAYSGGFACGEGITFNGVVFTFGYVKAGVLQWGGTGTTAELWAGGGTFKAGKNGLLMSTGSPSEMDDGNDKAVYGMIPGMGLSAFGINGYSELAAPNGDFETGSLTSWTATGSPAASSAQAHDGAYSCEFPNGSSNIVSSGFITTVRRGFVLDFWAMREAGSVSAPNLEILLTGYDGGGAAVATDLKTFAINTEGVWQRYMIPLVLTVAPAKVKIKISLSLSSTKTWVDTVRLYDTNNLAGMIFDSASDAFSLFTQDKSVTFFPRMITSDNTQPLSFVGGTGASGTVAAGTTAYLGCQDGFNATEANQRQQVPLSGKLKRFYVRTRSAQPGTGSLVFTVMVNGVDTGITVTVPAGSAAGLFSDTTNDADISFGQGVTLKSVNNASGASAQVAAWSVGLYT